MLRETERYYIDENDNHWSNDTYTKQQAEEYSKSLINCTNCTDCINCIDCEVCRYCTSCRDCYNCNHCNHCKDCKGLTNCSNCLKSNWCYNCRKCSYCDRCNDCTNVNNKVNESAKNGSLYSTLTVTDKYYVDENNNKWEKLHRL